jgi:hypothetical protein
MSTRTFVAIALGAGLLLAPAPGGAQQAAGCPVVEEGDAPPLELRFGDFVLRAQVKSSTGETGEGARVEGRLIGCEHDPRIPEAPVDPAADGPVGVELDRAGDPAAAFASALRLLHDLRVGLELAPGQDGRCVRASVDVTDAANDFGGTGGDRPLSLELCGLPFLLGEPDGV